MKNSQIIFLPVWQCTKYILEIGVPNLKKIDVVYFFHLIFVNLLQNATFGWVALYCQGIKSHQARVALYLYCNFHYQ